jgi:very-short-patch-repair endonuclease
MDEELLSASVITQQYVSEGKRILASQVRRDMTDAEKLLWHEVRAGKLGAHFRRQQVIDGFIVDFYSHAKKFSVESDGGVHDRPEQSEYDKERDRILGLRGIRVLRVKNDDIFNNMSAVLARIRAMIRE